MMNSQIRVFTCIMEPSGSLDNLGIKSPANNSIITINRDLRCPLLLLYCLLQCSMHLNLFSLFCHKTVTLDGWEHTQ